MKDDPVNHPKHYTSHPSKIEAIQLTEHMRFNVGNAVKYMWRKDLKGKGVQDLKKAAWYLEREIQRHYEFNKYVVMFGDYIKENPDDKLGLLIYKLVTLPLAGTRRNELIQEVLDELNRTIKNEE
ncbi:MAG TPA: DUF3310 domain-containing protein [Ferrovaceae bacterium]|jgi:hypothetical protein|nr:DUF3310 domain-containing protein [Ferrovaceae bacterium]